MSLQLMTEKQIIKQPPNTASLPLTHTIAVRPAYKQETQRTLRKCSLNSATFSI